MTTSRGNGGPVSRTDQMLIRMQEIQESAEAREDGRMTAEESTEFDKLEQETRAVEQTKRAEDEARSAKLAESRARYGHFQTGVPKVDAFDIDVRRADSQTVLSRAQSLIGDERSEITDHLTSEQRTHVDKLLRKSNESFDGSRLARHLIATSREEYRSAFQKMLLGRTDELAEPERRAIAEARATMVVGTDAQGGFAVPVVIDPTIILTAQGSPNPVMRLARVEQITTNKWRGISSAGMTWGFRAEGAVSGDGNVTVAQPVVRAHRADGTIPYSIEAEMDWPSFASEMARVIASGYNELLAQKLTVGAGDGSNEPTGLITALNGVAGSKVAVATSAVLVANDVYGLWKSLPAAFRMRDTTAFMSHTGTESRIRQFGAGASADANFSVNITKEGISTLFNKEYANNDYMSEQPAGVSTDLLLVIGDFHNYVVAQRMGMTVERVAHVPDPATGLPTGKRAMFAYARVGGGLVDGGAGFKVLVNK